MKICGIVAEYNPFHNGHRYHIEKTRELYGATHIVAVMSGNFTQRGDVAIMDKFDRARIALNNGVDLVIRSLRSRKCGTVRRRCGFSSP